MPASGYEYVICKSSQSVQWTAFSGQIPFIFKTPNRKWCKPRECFLAVKLKVDQVDGLATTAGNHGPLRAITGCTPYLSKNPVSTLFTTAKCLVNDKLISNMNELSATNTIFRTVYDTESMQRTIESSNPVIPQSIAETRAVYASRNQGLFNTFQENTLTWSLPLPLFQANEWIPPHTKVEVDFNVNTNWYQEIISCVGAFPAGGVVQLPVGGVNNVADSIGVGIDDISLWLYYATEETPVNMVKEIHLKQFFSQIHTITSTNESFILTLPNGGRSVTHLLGCFLQTGRSGTIKKSSNDFSSGYTNASPEVKIVTDAVTNLQMIRFILDKTYPNPDYDLNFSSALASNSKDVARAFYDFINNADAKFDRSGNVISIQQFIMEPIFCFKVNSDATTYNESLQVYITLNAGNGDSTGYRAGTSQLLVVALYDETLRLHYDTEKIVNIELVS